MAMLGTQMIWPADALSQRTAARGSTLRKIAVFSVLVSTVAIALAADLGDAQFIDEMNESMMRMHKAMVVSPTGNIDADFVAMMVPHHQGAIDMARIQLRYGHNEQLRRIAQEIIVDQQQEIAAMQYAARAGK
jgi:uncharacterized protein (DUF305 family)